ncbi:MAG: POTRA domain-containing protein [Planctomycetota bacterium]|nr:POTRA domain-containing protein [Planctomycetota bacterium]
MCVASTGKFALPSGAAFSIYHNSVLEPGEDLLAKDGSCTVLIHQKRRARISVREVVITFLVWGMTTLPLWGQVPLPRPGSPKVLNPEEITSARQLENQAVVNVEIQGASYIPADEYLRRLKTRRNRTYDPDDVQSDVEELHRLKIVQSVRSFIHQTSEGVVVTFRIFERPFITKVQYIGNRAFPDRRLEKLTGISTGKPLDVIAVKMAKRQIEDFYHSKGFPRTQVEVLQGDQRDHREVTFLVHEDEKRKIRSVKFEGNTIDSDGRLKTYIKSKPPIAGIIGGHYQKVEVEQDVQRLTAYYRSLGFFFAKVDREIIFDRTGTKVDLRFIIAEGPRYVVQSVSFVGNEKYDQGHLDSLTRSKANQYYDARRLQGDLSRLRDLYGSQGYIAVNIQAAPRLYETPGKLDLVFNIDEGPQYRVGDIKVHIDGEYGVTRQTVILDRLGLHRGDVVDVRKIRSAERRLAASQLFTGSRNDGPPPKIVVNPRAEVGALASKPNSGFRGQSPDQNGVRFIDLKVIPSPMNQTKNTLETSVEPIHR